MSVALWTIYRYCPAYELFGTEAEAARRAAYMDVYDLGDHGVCMGIQFEGGPAVAKEDWPAYREEAARRAAEDAARAAEAASRPPGTPLPQRTIRDPFCGFEMDVDASEPEWLGARMSARS